VDDFALTPAERALFLALDLEGVRFHLVGLGAALLEGAPVATQDLDIWLERRDSRVAAAAEAAGGFRVSGFGVQPPAFGRTGDGSSSSSPSHGVPLAGMQLSTTSLTRPAPSARMTYLENWWNIFQQQKSPND
jgi:hypothetical protein